MKFNNTQINQIIELFNSGKTQQDISLLFDCSRQVIGKILKTHGLERTASEAASIAIKSKLDSPDIVEQIRLLRPTHSLQELAKKFDSSVSSLHRICNKYNITAPDNYDELQSLRMKSAWTPDKKEAASKTSQANVTDELKQKLSIGSKELWCNDQYRMNQIKIQKEIWNKPENKERLAKFRANQSGKVSKIQQMLYDILNDLSIDYTPEYVIGPYNFDCLAGKFLIECQGDYWHSLDKAIRIDKAKSTYVERYCSEYTIKYLWEHEFYCLDRVIDTIKYWFGMNTIELIDFKFADVVIKQIRADEYKPFLTKYHYLCNADRGGIAFGGYINNQLISVCMFSPMVRHNIDTIGYDKSQVLELSRLCVHPKYQKHNYSSWFTSRCMKLLNRNIKLIISYCDSTFNHDGAIYKALNFVQDKVIRPDYWYADDNGWVMHKKTLYQRASKMSMTESDYADKFGYKKIYGKEKMRFVYER